MEYSDLSFMLKNYPTNRKLIDEEIRNQLHQKERLNITPFYNASTISLNSTYLETVDRWFVDRGSWTGNSILFGIIALLPLLMPFFIPTWHIILTKTDLTAMGAGFLVITIPVGFISLWMLWKESFRWTHYPIRFNYRNRMVYVFCLDGIIRSAKWEDIFFTLGRCDMTAAGQKWDVRGHALKADRETVEWTFALHDYGTDIQQLRHIWEFVRRYMEDGPEAVFQDVLWCHDITTRRETYREGLNVLYLQFNGHPIAQKLFAPTFWGIAVGRWIAMKTSKIPHWPAEVESQCVVDKLDPYQRTAAQNPKNIPTEPVEVGRSRIGH